MRATVQVASPPDPLAGIPSDGVTAPAAATTVPIGGAENAATTPRLPQPEDLVSAHPYTELDSPTTSLGDDNEGAVSRPRPRGRSTRDSARIAEPEPIRQRDIACADSSNGARSWWEPWPSHC